MLQNSISRVREKCKQVSKCSNFYDYSQYFKHSQIEKTYSRQHYYISIIKDFCQALFKKFFIFFEMFKA